MLYRAGGITIYLFADYHTHSQYSHGKGDIIGNLCTAWEKGLEEIAITDHGPALAFKLGVRDASVLLQIKAEINSLKPAFPNLKILCGVEANVLNREGDIDVPPEILQKMDIILVGLHPYIIPYNLETLRIVTYYLGSRFSRCLANKARLFNTEALIRAVERYKIDIITHPGLKLPIDTRELARACAQKGTALEINAGHEYQTREFIEIAAAEGAVFVVNSDAHHPEKVGCLEHGLALAKRAGLTAADIINARAVLQ